MRLRHIDWLRGVAVIAMIEWHALESWTLLGAERQGTAWTIIGTIGGFAAPLFLFLAGVAIPLAVASKMDRGTGRRAAAWAMQKRGWLIFGLAHLFRLQGFLLNPQASWNVLLKPDILNILGLSMAACAFCYGRARTARQTLMWLLVPALGCVLVTPFIRAAWWPTLLHPRLEAYFRPAGNFGVFSLFPWIALVFAGAIAGSWMANDRPAIDTGRWQRRFAAAGIVTLATGLVGQYLPAPFGNSAFWTTSLSFFLIRVGVMMLALNVSWLWMQRPTAARWSPLVVFGRTSLFVYWVHVEIAYGVFTYPIQRSLPLSWSIPAFVLFTALMLLAAAWWERRRAPLLTIPAHMRAMGRARG